MVNGTVRAQARVPSLCARGLVVEIFVRGILEMCARECFSLCAEDLPRSCHPFQIGIEIVEPTKAGALEP